MPTERTSVLLTPWPLLLLGQGLVLGLACSSEDGSPTDAVAASSAVGSTGDLTAQTGASTTMLPGPTAAAGGGASTSGAAASGTGGAGTSGAFTTSESASTTTSSGAVSASSGGASSTGQGGSTTTGATSNLPGYFVSPAGDDANPGTETEPFLTLTKARDVIRTVNVDMTQDIHVYLRGGTYRLTEPLALGPQDSGRNGFKIMYQGYPGEQPVVSGSTAVTGWTLHADNVYKAPLARTTKLRNLYVNDRRALMTSVRAASQGGYATFSVTAGEADWAWMSGSGSDGISYDGAQVPEIAVNTDDLEIVNGTTWNENIVCTRDVITDGGNRVLLFQQPYGAIAQLPGWNSGFSVTGTHTIYNAFEFLESPGEFYFDKTSQTLYYIPRAGEDMATATVEAPVLETLVEISGTSKEARVEAITFQGIIFENTDYNLYEVAGSRGKASVQGATIFRAYGDGNWHNSQYEILDTLPAMVEMNHANGIVLLNNTIRHSGSEGVKLVNDVSNVELIGNVISDIAGSAITVGHPQHVYMGDGGEHAEYTAAEEGICANNSITNNLLLNISSQPGFGGHSGITAFFVEGLNIEHNQIQTTAYNGISLGWGWRNFQDSTTCKNNNISFNRFIDTLNRLHDSGAVYTLGQMPDTTINQNYVKGIPAAASGPTYGLHNDEGSAYITENDNVLDISPDVTYTINAEDFGEKHDLTILRTYATVNKMGIDPPNSTIDPPVAVPDNVWPLAQYEVALNSGIEPEHAHIIPEDVLVLADGVFPASCAVSGPTSELPIRATGNPDYVVWLAPEGSSQFSEGPTMTQAGGMATSVPIPSQPGSYRLYVLDAQGTVLGASDAVLRAE